MARARALRPRLLERQEETEQLTYYRAATHEEFQQAGLYRILQPRRFGGYEHDVPTFCRVIAEVSRGCPSTGWCLCPSSAHVLQVASLFEERAQAEVFAPDGDFRAASFSSPVGVAVPGAVGAARRLARRSGDARQRLAERAYLAVVGTSASRDRARTRHSTSTSGSSGLGRRRGCRP